jgi:hypothetical protein
MTRPAADRVISEIVERQDVAVVGRDQQFAVLAG